MTKADLRTGMRVTLRNGEERLVLQCFQHEYDDVGYNSRVWDKLSNYTDDMKMDGNYGRFDIIKVEIPRHCHSVLDQTYDKDNAYKTVWEEIKEVTLKEVEEKFGCKVKIVG